MLSRFSVKRPYIIVVAVIVCLILGGVSISRMKTDLLPNMDMPYLAVITTDPGASAEKVEDEVTNVLESSLSTISGVKTTQSISSDNFSLVFLQFEDGTDMDSALVKVSSACNSAQSELPDGAGTPNFMEISTDMMASMYVAASCDDKDIYETSDYAENTLAGQLERVDGVADVSLVGTVDKSVEVRLNDDKIEQVNNRLLAHVNSELYDAKKKITKGKNALKKAEKQLKTGEKELKEKQEETTLKLGTASTELTKALAALESQKALLNSQISTAEASKAALDGQVAALKAQLETVETEEEKAALQAQIDELEAQAETYEQQVASLKEQLEPVLSQLEAKEKEVSDASTKATAGSITAGSSFGAAQAQITTGKSTIASQKQSLEEAEDQYEEARDAAIEAANIDSLVEKTTLANLIKANNFSMPAGYVDTDSDEQWLLKVGDNLTSVKELKNLMLVKLDGVGNIYLKDVADVTVIDNVGDSYMRVNDQDAIMLSVFKTSTASTSDVSTDVTAELEQIMEADPNVHLDVLYDQGSSIFTYIRTILQSLILGALLAIVVLALFLKDLKPTLIVAFSIPFSVLCAMVVMYFSGLNLNIMTLGGLSLAIGMLVDNSIVVMENIYRLRGRGISAPRAAVQGAKQITGAVVASTLTTVCVFLPIVFTTGIVNQMLLPFALTITYVLTASLVVALTLVPAVSSKVFTNYKPKTNKLFDKLQNVYGKSLAFFLRHKVLPLGLSLVLLGGAVYGVATMGVSLIPSMTTSSVRVTVTMPEGTEKEVGYPLADKVMDAAMKIDGVKTVGAMDGTATVSMLSTSASSSNSEKLAESFMFYILVDDTVQTEEQVQAIKDQLAESTKDLDCEVETDSTSSMSSMLGSGLSVELTGTDMDKLVDLSEEVMDAVGQVEGYTEIENGMEDADKELHLVVDRDELTKKGYTVAQLYTDLAAKLTTETTATEMTVNDYTMDVTVVDETSPITKENLLNTKIKITTTGSDGSETNTYRLSKFAHVEETEAASSIQHTDSVRTMEVTAEVADGYNNTLLSRQLQEKLDAIDVPDGYTLELGGELDNVNTMLSQMILMLLLGFILIYLVMVAQFQSLLSPFIIIFTVPLAFTGGLLGLLACGEQLTMLSLMGFAVLMGTVVNNGIVFVDYVNQLRIGGLEKRDALVATGRTRMRPILMTALTTILAMLPMVFSHSVGSSMERGMAIVVVGGLAYATLMTLYVVPCLYDIMYRKKPHVVDLGDESIDDDPGDAQAYLASLAAKLPKGVKNAAAALAGPKDDDLDTPVAVEIPEPEGNEDAGEDADADDAEAAGEDASEGAGDEEAEAANVDETEEAVEEGKTVADDTKF